MRKKIFSLMLALCMLLSFAPTASLAANTIQVHSAEEFKDALASAEGTTIQFEESLDLSGLGVVDISGLTLDLNGKTISANNFSLIFQGTNFTIKNGTFDAKGGSYALFIGEDATSNVTVEDITAVGGINVYNSTNVVLRNVNVTGSNYYAIWCDEGGQVTVESGSFSTNGVAVLGVAAGDVDASLDINGGSFSTNGKPLVLEDASYRKPPVISSGTFDAPVDAKYIEPSATYASVSANGTVTYHIGRPDILSEKIGSLANEGSAVNVYQGDLQLNQLPANVTVSNQGDGAVLVNQVPAIKDQTPIVSHQHSAQNIAAKQPTCTSPGNIEYWHCSICDTYFSDSALNNTISQQDTIVAVSPNQHVYGDWVVTKPLLNIDGSRVRTCSECNAIESETIPALKAPVVVAGNGESWKQGSAAGLSFTSNAPFADFLSVSVDGAVLSDANFTKAEGSTIITLKPAYLKTLSPGKHTIEISSMVGNTPAGATAEFTVLAQNTFVPQTGDSFNSVLWLLLLAISGCGIIFSFCYMKKKTEK